MKFWTLLVAIALCVLGTPLYSQEGEADKLKNTMNAALDVLYLEAYADYTYEQQQTAVQALLEESYDLTVIIRRALARNWNLLSADEQVRVAHIRTDRMVIQATAASDNYCDLCGHILSRPHPSPIRIRRDISHDTKEPSAPMDETGDAQRGDGSTDHAAPPA